MPDGGITGGVLRYMQRVKTGEYEHKEALAELHFGVNEGYDYRPYFDKAAEDAMSKVKVMLGLAASERRPVGHPRTVVPVLPNPARPVIDAKPLSSETGVTVGEGAVTEVRTSDPKAAAGAEAVRSLADVAAESVGEAWEEAPAEPAKEVTDKELNDACGRRNKALVESGKKGGAVAIRALVAKYAPPPGQLRNIPQDKRAEFLAALDKVEVKE